MLNRPALLLRTEEVTLLGVVVLVYAHLHFSWLMFGLLFFAPDISMVGYLANPRLGSALYNAGHTLTLPLLLVSGGYWMGRTVLMATGLIWVGHIAFDRMLGYGLKYPAAFKDTHLQRIS